MTEEEARRNVSANIRHLLRIQNWNTARLEEQVDPPIPHATIYRIVRGESIGSVMALAAIARALDSTVDYLLADHGNSSTDADGSGMQRAKGCS